MKGELNWKPNRNESETMELLTISDGSMCDFSYGNFP